MTIKAKRGKVSQAVKMAGQEKQHTVNAYLGYDFQGPRTPSHSLFPRCCVAKTKLTTKQLIYT